MIDLYPNDAYLGMVDATQSFYDSAVAIYNSYPYGWGFSVDTLGSKSSFSYAEGKDEELEYVSDENEIEILEMTSEEIVKFKAMNELARMEDFETLDDILKIGYSKNYQEANFNWVQFALIAYKVASYIYNRALLCAQRAIAKTEVYYPSNHNSGQKGDAYRHAFVNVMLRYDLSRTWA